MKPTALLLLTVLLGVCRLQAQLPGTLDSTFSNDGKLRIDYSGSYEVGNAIRALPNGKTIIAGATYLYGDYDYTLIKLNANGTYDSTFGTNGTVITRIAADGDFITNMELQPDGKVLISGYCNTCTQHYWYLLRYKTNGTLDSSFGTNGINKKFYSVAHTSPSDIEVLPDSSILLSGHLSTPQGYQMAVAKYTADGQIDSSFGTNGAVTPYFGYFQCAAAAVRTLPNGNILLAGLADGNPVTKRNFALVQLQPNGVRDSTFGVNGVVVTDFDSLDEHINQVILQPDGKIVAVGGTGYINTAFAMARYHANGTLDSTFGSNGLAVNNMSVPYSDYITDVVLQPDGKLTVGARIDNNVQSPYNSSPVDFIVARYTATGLFDSTFGTNGLVKTSFSNTFRPTMSKISLAPNNKLVAVGMCFDNALQSSDMVVARYFLGPDTTTTPACVNTSASFTETICKGDVYSFNGTNLFAGGIYTDTIPNGGGCDSVMQLTLLVDTVKYLISPPHMYSAAYDITVYASADSYQWIHCLTNQPVPGATDSTWYFTEAGSYRCIITKGLCTDTTACITAFVINDITRLTDNLKLYPNPANEQITLTHNSTTPVDVFICNTTGQVLRKFKLTETTTVLDISTLPRGIYNVTLSGENLHEVKKLVKW